MFTRPNTNHLVNVTSLAHRSTASFDNVSFKSAAKFISTHLSRILNALAQSNEDRQRARLEAYLAEATDIYDLEWRMRELDRREQHARLPMMDGIR